jgi:hypothetical protein
MNDGQGCPFTCLPASSLRIVTGRGLSPALQEGRRVAVGFFLPVYGEKCPAGQ